MFRTECICIFEMRVSTTRELVARPDQQRSHRALSQLYATESNVPLLDRYDNARDCLDVMILDLLGASLVSVVACPRP